MGNMNFRNRIKKAQARTKNLESMERIAALIAAGAYYDELTDDEKNTYCDYLGSERYALETLHEYFNGNLHFKLERKPKPLTDLEFKERVREVERDMEAYRKRYREEKKRERMAKG